MPELRALPRFADRATGIVSADRRPSTSTQDEPGIVLSRVEALERLLQTRWDRNRVFDIDALSIAVAYCDVVVTDREAAHTVQSEGLSRRLETKAMASLDEVAAVIG